MTQNSGIDFTTKIPSLSEDANIQDALQTFLYGSPGNASAAEGTLTSTTGDEGLVGHLNTMKQDAIDDNRSLIPAGTVVMWAGSSANIPDGWLLCDGSTFSSGTYPELYAALNNTTALPSTNGRYVRAVTSTARGVGGSNTISTAQMPAHNHGGAYTGSNYSVSTGVSANHVHGVAGAIYWGPLQTGGSYQPGWLTSGGTATGWISSDHTHTIYLNSAGSGSAFYPSYINFLVLIKT